MLNTCRSQCWFGPASTKAPILSSTPTPCAATFRDTGHGMSAKERLRALKPAGSIVYPFMPFVKAPS